MESLSTSVGQDYAWYFAYGSNLSKSRIEQRTGSMPSAKRACLYHYRLSFNLHADDTIYANIIPCRQSLVWGSAYWMSREMMAALDLYEGVDFGCYHRATVEIHTEDRERLQAETYVGGATFVADEGRPSDAYLQVILTGAREHGLPEEYIRLVEECGL